MRRLLSVAFAFLLAGSSFAGRTPGFSMSAFNAVVPSSSSTVVFSPVSFELDCALISEAFGPIEKAVYVEALGALVGYDSVYKPILACYSASATNDMKMVSARAFLASSLRMISTKYRSFIQSEYGANACPVSPTADGAESFLRVSMDGEMEDFRVTDGMTKTKGVSFCDLESFRCSWAEAFPADNTRKSGFASADGVSREVMMMSDRRDGDIWKCGRFSVLRLPMSGGAFFFAVLPEPGVPLDSIRGEFAAAKLDEALVAFKAVADPAVYHGPVDVSIPRMTVDSVVDIKPAFLAFGLPLGGFKELHLGADSTLGALVQRTRFVLDERGTDEVRVKSEAADASDSVPRDVRKFVCDRPFLFFICHEPTRTVPVSGIYAGEWRTDASESAK